MIELNDLLEKTGLDPRQVMVMRHCPTEKALRLTLPTLAAEQHDVFNAYQCQHGARVENALAKASHLASFIGHEAGQAMFIGLYEVVGSRRISVAEYWRMPGNAELKALGTRGPADGLSPLWFDLRLQPSLSDLKGRLVVEWPGIERAWWRWASRNQFRVQAIHEESRLIRPMPAWNEIVLTWNELKLLPMSWRHALSQWRGIYYIFDTAMTQGYVGSASGSENILGRWKDYAARGHGGNSLLKRRSPENFIFSVLELMAPSIDSGAVIAAESSWKQRLHTRAPLGLNDN